VGNEEIKVAVADAGPLIHLSEIGVLTLLHVFDAIHVPHAVWLEIGEHSENICKCSSIS
jgi:predicted nucleic acid-binding protein